MQEKIAARQMTAISSSLLNEILERLRETQIIVGTMSQAAHISTLGAEGEGNPASNSSEDIPATPPASTDYLSSELAQRSTKRPRNDQEVRSSPNRSFQSNQQETASLKTDNFAQQAEAGPKSAPTFRQDMNFSGPTLARAEYFTPGPRLGMHFNNQWLADPWSSNMPRFAGHQQQQSSVPSYQELDLPGTTGYMGTEFGILSSPSLDVNLNSFDQEWFESLEFPNLETGNQAQSSSYDQMSETR